jgi:cytochrome c556
MGAEQQVLLQQKGKEKKGIRVVFLTVKKRCGNCHDLHTQ